MARNIESKINIIHESRIKIQKYIKFSASYLLTINIKIRWNQVSYILTEILTEKIKKILDK